MKYLRNVQLNKRQIRSHKTPIDFLKYLEEQSNLNIHCLTAMKLKYVFGLRDPPQTQSEFS